MDPDTDSMARSLERQLEELHAQVAQLLRAVERARHLGALGVLAAAVAHELNNILTPVHGYARSALTRPDDTELGHRALKRAADGAERGAQLARSILALAGEATVEPATPDEGVGIAEVAGEAVDLTRTELDGAGVEVVVVGDGVLGVSVGRFAMVQVLQNLLLNAAGAMRGRGGCVRIGWRRCNHPDGEEKVGGDWVCVEVRDNGPGIPGAVRERLFKPFATAMDRAGAGGEGRGVGGGGVRLGGSGLGLSICKGLIEATGGRIEVESAVGEGTTFRLFLPGAKSPQTSASNLQ